MMNRTFVCAAVAASMLFAVAPASAVGPLFSNVFPDPSLPALNPQAFTIAGPLPGLTPQPAPAGEFWSELQHRSNIESNNTLGLNTRVGGGVNRRAADDIVVPAEGWRLTGATFYNYVANFVPSAVTPSPTSAAFLRVWDGRPGDTGSNIIFGDLTTNLLTDSSFTGIYRIDNTRVQQAGTPPPTPTTSRRIFANEVAFDLELAGGTYWMEWSFDLATGVTGSSFSPLVTIPGSRGLPEFNARVFTGTTWINAEDRGFSPPTAFFNPPTFRQDFPFLLTGTVIPEPATLGLLGVAGVVLLRRRR